MRYREMTAADVAAGHALSRASGWNQRPDDWELLLSRNPGRFVAAVSSDGRVVGTAGAACYGTALAWVCMVLVDAGARGRGIGTRLMEAVLERLGDMALVGLDATPQGRPVYARLGFTEDRTFLRLGAEGVSAAGDGSVIPLGKGDLEAVLALDRDVFGADRSEVLRWAFERAPAWCGREGGRVAAYCFGRPGEHSRHVGPVVAPGTGAARSLLAAAASGVPGRLIVDVAADREDWVAAAAGLGFREQRPLIRMYRGGGGPPGRPDLQLAIFGPEFG